MYLPDGPVFIPDTSDHLKQITLVELTSPSPRKIAKATVLYIYELMGQDWLFYILVGGFIWEHFIRI